MSNESIKVDYEIDVLKTDIIELIQDDKVQFDEMMVILLGMDNYLKMINDGIINDEYVSDVRTCKESALNLIEQHLCEKHKENELFSSDLLILERLYEKLKDIKNKYNCKFEKYPIIDGLNKLKSCDFNVLGISDILNDNNLDIFSDIIATTSYHNLSYSLNFHVYDSGITSDMLLKKINEIDTIQNDIKKFLINTYNNNQIPDRGILTFVFNYIDRLYAYTTRDVFIKNYGYWIINRQNINNLKEFIGDSKVLEIMAGTGYVGNLLSMNGVDIISTDNNSWNDTFNTVYRRDDCIDCIKAIEKYGKECDVLLMSWVPYQETIGAKAMSLYHEINPNGAIIWIGEPEGGCCGCEEDFEVMRRIGRSEELEDIFNYNFEQFFCINDEAYIMDPTGKRTMTKYIGVDNKIEKISTQ